jgi:hypothetical protein
MERTMHCWAVGYRCFEQTNSLHLQGPRGHILRWHSLYFFKVLGATAPVMQHVTDDMNPKQMHFSSSSTAFI